jgi:hypothetical protein
VGVRSPDLTRCRVGDPTAKREGLFPSHGWEVVRARFIAPSRGRGYEGTASRAPTVTLAAGFYRANTRFAPTTALRFR